MRFTALLRALTHAFLTLTENKCIYMPFLFEIYHIIASINSRISNIFNEK